MLNNFTGQRLLLNPKENVSFIYWYKSLRFHCNVYYILHFALVTYYIVIYLYKCYILLIYVSARDTTLIYISIIRFKGLIIIKLKRWLLANVQLKLLPVKYWNYFCCEMFGELSHWMRWSQIIFFGKFKLGYNKCFRIGCHKNRHNFVNIEPTILVRYSKESYWHWLSFEHWLGSVSSLLTEIWSTCDAAISNEF